MRWSFCGQGLPLGQKTYIMGILNVTPDSFSDGGRYMDPDKAVERALQLAGEGADLLDVGGQSTRPGHTPVSAAEEWARLEPVLKALEGQLSIPISVDTFYPFVAKRALELGAHIINDVSGIVQPEMAAVVRAYGAGWVIMHTGGGDADHTGEYRDDILTEVRGFFEQSAERAEQLGVPASQLCMDMGIGFGKTYQQNLRLLGNTGALRVGEMALLTGVSRKRVVGQATGVKEPMDRVYGNVSAHTAAIAGGTDVLRVHDVAESVQGAAMADAIYRTRIGAEHG